VGALGAVGHFCPLGGLAEGDKAEMYPFPSLRLELFLTLASEIQNREQALLSSFSLLRLCASFK